MIFTKTEFKGVFIIEIEKEEDQRGFFARIWDKKEFERLGIDSEMIQCSISFNKKRGTLRGMHYQMAPYEETKIVRCTRGKIFDVIIDLRKESSTFKQWLGIELDEENHKMIYVPKGFAHGFQTLKNDTEVFYQISEKYMPRYSRGIRWDDKAFKIKWPLKPTIISKKDYIYHSFKL